MAQAYGSITLVDVSDLGQLSVVPESNQPLTVIYNPDNNSYFPNWGNENLILTPVIYYGGKELKYGDNGVTINWKQKINSGDETPAITNGTISDGKLVISGNPFSNDNTIYTYIVIVNYVDSSYGIDLQAKGQISFSLIKHASKIKDIKITGESVFLYKGDGSLQSNSSIILTATANGTSIQKWQYKESNGNWVDILNQTSQTLTVNAEDDYFVNDLANIRVLADDLIENTTDYLYDEHSIIKIRQGANGTSTVSAILSNDDQMLPADKDGKVSSYEGASTKITIYSGSTDITDKYTINLLPSDSTIEYDFDSETYTCIVKGFGNNLDVGYITFNCQPIEGEGYTETIIKKFSLTKIKTGADGVSPEIFSLSVNSLAINKSTGGAYTPSELVATAYLQKGQEKTEYTGRFRFYLDDSTIPLDTIPVDDRISYSYQIANVNKNIKIELYEKGGFNKLLDTQTVIITSDGIQGPSGEDGEPGTDALNFVLGNYSDLIPCASDGKVAVATEIKIPFSAYKGITKVACSATVGTLPNGVTSSISNSSSTLDGAITLTFAKNATLDDKKTGSISITLTAESQSSAKSYTWTKNIQATNGQNSVILQIHAPQGNIISNNENNVNLKATLVDGADEPESGITYEWYIYKKVDKVFGYHLLSQTTKEITITPQDIESYNSFKCIATYKNIPYEAYISVYDKTDPLQIVVQSTVGDKLINGVGEGIIYALVYRNGEEIDHMKTLNYGTSLPTDGVLGDYFWLLNSDNKTAILHYYTGSAWTNSDIDSGIGTYVWDLIDHSGTSEPVTKEGKAIYVDKNVVNKKMTFNVKVII